MTWGDEKGRDLPSNWDSEIVPRILARDGHRCRWILPISKTRCPGRQNLEVDHIGDENDHSDRNLRTLCRLHHGKRTAKQGWAAKAKKKQDKLRPREEHPNW